MPLLKRFIRNSYMEHHLRAHKISGSYAFFEEQGVSGDDFDQAYQSKDVKDNVRFAYLMGQSYGLSGVPAIIINGKYGTSASMAGGYNEIIDVVNTLAAKEYANMNE